MHLGERKEAFASAPSYQGLPQVPAVYPPLPHHWAVHLWVWGGVPNGRFRGALGQATWYVAQTCSKALVVKFQVKMVPTTTGKEAGLRTAGSLRAATLRTMTQPFPLFPRINPKSSTITHNSLLAVAWTPMNRAPSQDLSSYSLLVPNLKCHFISEALPDTILYKKSQGIHSNTILKVQDQYVEINCISIP